MQKLVDILAGSTPEISEMRSLLYRRFLSNSGGVSGGDLSSREDRLCRYLVAEGALLYDGTADIYWVPYLSATIVA